METEVNREGPIQPVHTPGLAPSQGGQRQAQTSGRPHHTAVGGGRPRRKILVLGVTLLILVMVGLFWSWWLFGRNIPFNENKNVNTAEYQAVFLTNGQVYFGKLANLNNRYVTITDVYYLQVQQNSSSSLQGASSATSPSSQVSLVKLGNELHGPQDEMYISSQQMLFWENLKDSGKVVQAIDKYQSQ
jgi:hypothetical protein